MAKNNSYLDREIQAEADRIAAEEAAKAEADRIAAEEAAKAEADRIAAEQAAQIDEASKSTKPPEEWTMADYLAAR